jgi:hypothetical protein
MKYNWNKKIMKLAKKVGKDIKEQEARGVKFED